MITQAQRHRLRITAGGRIFLTAFLLITLSKFCVVQADYRMTDTAGLKDNAVGITKPGVYAESGTLYMLKQDISSPGSALYLGKDVTLDLNGHTITFLDAGYEHIPNYSFENGLAGWDCSIAPGAQVVDDKVHVFIGKNILSLKKGDEIVSSPLTLPVAKRSYFAMCGVTMTGMKVSLFIETADGETISCQTFDGNRVSCPVVDKTVRLGGGFVTAHMHGKPAGDYRLRVRAETDCLIDHIDLRPAMDVGIGIIGDTFPNTHTDDFFEWKRSAFFDEAKNASSDQGSKLPKVTGSGTITIRNGTIKSATRSILSWGIQSTAEDCRINLENVRIVNAGINANAADIPFGRVKDCRFEVDTPFIINRHASEHSVVMRDTKKSEIVDSVFLGGQGCLTVKGNSSTVHGNLFVNQQTITNHYCVMVAADSVKVFENRFEPETGSGLEIYVHKYNEIFDNVFRITASPPTCEYGHEDYSVNGIRIADYNAKAGAPNACLGNRVYRNTFHIVGKDYPEYTDYIPMAYGVFHSVSGGNNYYENNVFHVNHRSPGTKAEAAACYISGHNAGQWKNNTIITNTSAFWIGSRYGEAHNGVFEHNTIIKRDDAPEYFMPVRLGFSGREGAFARDIEFRSNTFVDMPLNLQIEGGDIHKFSVYWTLTVKVYQSTGVIASKQKVTVDNKLGEFSATGTTNSDGEVSFELLEYAIDENSALYTGIYTIQAGKTVRDVRVEKNTGLQIILK